MVPGSGITLNVKRESNWHFSEQETAENSNNEFDICDEDDIHDDLFDTLEQWTIFLENDVPYFRDNTNETEEVSP